MMRSSLGLLVHGQLLDVAPVHLDAAEPRGETPELRRGDIAITGVRRRLAQVPGVQRRGARQITRPLPRARRVPQRVDVRRETIRELERIRGVLEVAAIEGSRPLIELLSRLGA